MQEELSKIGLSKYEILSYLTLIKYPELKGNEIAIKTDIPRPSVYPTLERLENKKFIYVKQQNPKSYVAIKPEIAIKAYIERRNKEFERNGDEAISSLQTLENQENEKEGVKLLFGKEQSLRAAKNSQRKVKQEYLIMGDGLNKSSLVKSFQQFEEMLKRGVTIYLITLPKYKEEAQEVLKKLKQAGMKIGFYPVKNLSFTISDRQKCSIGIKSKNFEGGRIVSTFFHKDLAEFQSQRFMEIWSSCEKF